MKARIREERAGDGPVIRRLTGKDHPAGAEADLADALRAAGALTLSLVFESDGRIVGHIAFSPAVIEGEKGQIAAVALGPMSVDADCQREGVGSCLVAEGLSRLRLAGHGAVFVYGHPCYFPRFGFLPSWRRGLYWEHRTSEESFMVLELVEGYLEGIAGIVRLHPLFEKLIA